MFILASSSKQSNTLHISYRHRYYPYNLITYSYRAWFKNRKAHRIGAPAIVSYFKNGNIEYEMWFKNNKLHRRGNAPTVIFYFENGQIRDKKWINTT